MSNLTQGQKLLRLYVQNLEARGFTRSDFWCDDDAGIAGMLYVPTHVPAADNDGSRVVLNWPKRPGSWIAFKPVGCEMVEDFEPYWLPVVGGDALARRARLGEFGCFVRVYADSSGYTLESVPIDAATGGPEVYFDPDSSRSYIDWAEVTAPEEQAFLDRVNEIFATEFELSQFAGR